MKRVFSRSTVRIAAEKMRRGEKPAYCISDKLSREDIDKAWRLAVEHTFGRLKNKTPPDNIKG